MNDLHNETQPHRYYTKVIHVSSWVAAVATAILCVLAFMFLMSQPETEQITRRAGRGGSERSPVVGLIVMPFGGYLLGMALAVLFAPSSYLTSDEGQKWMKMVGVKTVGLTRVVSLIFALFGIAFLAFFTLALLTDDFKKPLF